MSEENYYSSKAGNNKEDLKKGENTYSVYYGVGCLSAS